MCVSVGVGGIAKGLHQRMGTMYNIKQQGNVYPTLVATIKGCTKMLLHPKIMRQQIKQLPFDT